MERLRPRDQRKEKEFSGFTTAEVEKMEKLLRESESERQLLSKQFCLKTAQCFNRSTGRAGKPVVKWIQVQNWFENQLRDNPFLVNSSNDTSKQISVQPETCPPVIADDNTQRPKGVQLYSPGEAIDISDLDFEARSAKDKAWYDVDAFLAHRVVASGEPEARVRFVGFGAEEDEWVNIKADVRIRSVPFEASECYSIRAGDLVLCFQERKDQAIYYDAHVLEIQRRLHDIRGCRCLFLVRYDHDNSEERVRLRRLCCRPLC